VQRDRYPRRDGADQHVGGQEGHSFPQRRLGRCNRSRRL
jgi:hypothetical protein